MRARLIPVVVLVIVCLAEQPAGGTIKAGRLGIGDSVMLGAREELHARGFGIVDAVTSRQFSSAASRVRYWKGAGKLPKNVVIHLGNNGIVLRSDCANAVQAAGRRRVFLVTLKVPRPWRAADNRRLRRCARRFRNAYLVDWYRHSHDHPGWFAKDGYHLTGSGATAYAGLISRRIAAVG